MDKPSIQIVNRFPMQWESGVCKAFSGWQLNLVREPRETPDPDIRLFMWCDEDTQNFVKNNHTRAKNIVFIRRYEYYSKTIDSMDWNSIDAVVMVNTHLAKGFKHRTGVEPFLIPNGIDPEKWTWQKHGHGRKVAVVGMINKRKNLPLAIQVIASLPDSYELHIAGAVLDGELFDYAIHMIKRLKRKAHFYGNVNDINTWLDDKDYLLSTSISEGCPNSVIEAMAKGIKPVIHDWPGADTQFSEFTWRTIEEAVQHFMPISIYASKYYRWLALKNNGPERYSEIEKLAQKVLNGN